MYLLEIQYCRKDLLLLTEPCATISHNSDGQSGTIDDIHSTESTESTALLAMNVSLLPVFYPYSRQLGGIHDERLLMSQSMNDERYDGRGTFRDRPDVLPDRVPSC